MNAEEEKELVRLLGLLKEEGSFLPLSVFKALAEVIPRTALEVVIARWNANDEPEVLLIRRPPDDPHWPDLWHSPGTMLRNMERLDTAFKRLQENELGFSFKEHPKFVTWWNDLETGRGHEVSLIYRHVVPFNFDPPEGRFFPVRKLPEDILPHHPTVTAMAAYAK